MGGGKSCTVFLFRTQFIETLQLRKTYKVVRAIQEVSGWHWDDRTGASINPDTASSWDDYVKHHPNAKPFRNNGWVHLQKMSLIMPSSTPGANVYHAAVAPPPTPSASPSTTPAPSASPSTTPEPPSTSESATAADTAPRKRPHDSDTPAHSTSKRSRASTGAEALLNMSNSLTGLGTALTAALAPPSTGLLPTPLRRSNAIGFAVRSEKGWLANTELVALIDFLRADQTAADVYIAIEEEDVRKEWVRIQLERLHIHVF